MVDVPRTADVVIVGGGVHGASLAYHLARKKAGRVVLIEKKFVASGPTGRSTALVRRFYAMDFFTRTASAAADVFRHWKDVVGGDGDPGFQKAEEHTSELQSRLHLVCRLLLEKKKNDNENKTTL